MYKTTVKIEGMACGMCEAHVCEAIRQAIPGAKRISASHRKGEAVFFSESGINPETLADVIGKTGYKYVSSDSSIHEKKGIFGR